MKIGLFVKIEVHSFFSHLKYKDFLQSVFGGHNFRTVSRFFELTQSEKSVYLYQEYDNGHPTPGLWKWHLLPDLQGQSGKFQRVDNRTCRLNRFI